MTDERRMLVAGALATMRAAFPADYVDVNDSTIDVWSQTLADLDARSIAEAAAIVTRRAVKFPTLTEFRDAVTAVRRDRRRAERELPTGSQPTLTAEQQQAYLRAVREAFAAARNGADPDETFRAVLAEADVPPPPPRVEYLSPCRGCDGGGFSDSEVDDDGYEFVTPCRVCRFGAWLRFSEGHARLGHTCAACSSPKAWAAYVEERQAVDA